MVFATTCALHRDVQRNGRQIGNCPCRAKKAEARGNDILAIKQSPVEGLRDFLAQFHRVRMTLLDVLEGMAVAAF